MPSKQLFIVRIALISGVLMFAGLTLFQRRAGMPVPEEELIYWIPAHAALVPGDVVIVRPGEVVPVDGTDRTLALLKPGRQQSQFYRCWSCQSLQLHLVSPKFRRSRRSLA